MLLHKSIEHDSRVRREARALARAGHDVTVVHLPPTPGELDGELDGFRVVSATPPAWVRERVPFSLYRLVFLIWFVRAVLRQRPEAVHAHDTAMLVPGWLAARRARARLVYDTHEYAPGVPYRERTWALFVATIERLLIRRCAAVITVSDGIADRLKERYALSERPAVVRNLPDVDVYDAGFEAPDLRAGLGVGDAPLVLHLGAVAQDRGCETLVKALAGVERAHLLFLGADDRAYAERLEEVAAAAGVTERVHFLSSVRVPHVLAYVRQADVGVSLLEDTCDNHRLALPNKVFEYVAAGVPVVVSRLPELERLVREQRIGWTADPSDPVDVSRVLSEALTQSGAAASASRLGQARERLTWGREQDRLLSLYRTGRPVEHSQPSRPRALVLVRNPCSHDARVLREARVLRRMGCDSVVVGVVSTSDPDRSSVIDGVPVVRLAPSSPFGKLTKARKRKPSLATGRSASSGRSTGTAAPAGAATRVHRWLVTLDYYRRGIGLARRRRPALVHCNDYNTMWIGVGAKLLCGSRLVYDSHELWPDRNLRPEPRWWLLMCEALFVRVADRVITTSPGYSQLMAERYRIGGPQVIRNIPEAASLPRAGVPTDRVTPLAVYFGAVTSGRGLEAMLEALSLVGDEDVRLRILGPEAWGYRERLQVLAEELGVDARVEFGGAVSPAEAGSVLAGADVGLALIEPACLSYELTLPNKLFEYTAAGLPILGAELPVISEFVNGYGVGATVAPDRPHEIAQALGRLLEPKRNRDCRQAACRTAASLTWASESRLLEGIYERLLSRSA